MKKSISISIRVSEEELDKFKQAARLEAYASYSEFVRRTALIEAAKIIKKICKNPLDFSVGIPYNSSCAGREVHVTQRRAGWGMAPVVQLVRISACHAEGRGFESRPDRQLMVP